MLLQAPPKQKPRTIENSRVPDETIVCADDDEVRSSRDSHDIHTIYPPLRCCTTWKMMKCQHILVV